MKISEADFFFPYQSLVDLHSTRLVLYILLVGSFNLKNVFSSFNLHSHIKVLVALIYLSIFIMCNFSVMINISKKTETNSRKSCGNLVVLNIEIRKQSLPNLTDK